MSINTKGLLAAATVSTAVALTVSQPAFAAPRGEEPAGFYELEAGLGCAFPLRLETSAGAVRVISFEMEDGTIGHITSVKTGVVLTYTNVATGESVRIKTSGSVTRAVVDGDTEIRTATGHNGLILFPDDVPAGPTATQYNGRIVYRYNTVTGFTEVIETSGKARDICAELS